MQLVRARRRRSFALAWRRPIKFLRTRARFVFLFVTALRARRLIPRELQESVSIQAKIRLAQKTAYLSSVSALEILALIRREIEEKGFREETQSDRACVQIDMSAARVTNQTV